MILASHVLVQLWQDLGTVGGVVGATWKQDPFRGTEARADAAMVVCYQQGGTDGGHTKPTIQPELRTDTWRMSPGYTRHWLIVEIDAVSETHEDLIARAENWRAAWPSYLQQVPPGVVTRFVWVTTGTWRRAKTIWEIWNDYAWLPLVISTMKSIKNPGDGRFHPGHPLRRAADGTLHAVWRDELGRVRSLIPGMLHEDRWIAPVSMVRQRRVTFREACADQDRQEPLAQWCDGDLIRLGSGPRQRQWMTPAHPARDASGATRVWQT
jgi:hypothetical protein